MVHPPYSAEMPQNFEVNKKIEFIKKNSKKDIWPWLFFNRFIGGDDIRSRARANIDSENLNYFSRLPGMDLVRGGNFCEFKEIFRNSIRLAKKLNSPGVIIDHEAYNNNKIYKLKYLASLMDTSTDNVRKSLLDIGRQLAEVTLEEYPNAILWFFSTSPHISTSIIAEGILKTSVQYDIPLKVIDGGEHTIRYVNNNLKELENRIKSRKDVYESWKFEYGDRLQFGATIALTHTPDLRKGWISKKYDKNKIKEANDLLPHLKMLFSSHKYVWIYAASATQFNPFDPNVAAPYHSVIEKALEENCLK